MATQVPQLDLERAVKKKQSLSKRLRGSFKKLVTPRSTQTSPRQSLTGSKGAEDANSMLGDDSVPQSPMDSFTSEGTIPAMIPEAAEPQLQQGTKGEESTHVVNLHASACPAASTTPAAAVQPAKQGRTDFFRFALRAVIVVGAVAGAVLGSAASGRWSSAGSTPQTKPVHAKIDFEYIKKWGLLAPLKKN